MAAIVVIVVIAPTRQQPTTVPYLLWVAIAGKLDASMLYSAECLASEKIRMTPPATACGTRLLDINAGREAKK